MSCWLQINVRFTFQRIELFLSLARTVEHIINNICISKKSTLDAVCYIYIYLTHFELPGTIWTYADMSLGKAFIPMCSWRTCIMEAQESLVRLSLASIDCLLCDIKSDNEQLFRLSPFLWCIKYICTQLLKSSLQMAPKTHGAMPPSRNHRKTVSPPELHLHAYIYERLIALCKYFALDRGCFVFLCIDRCPTTHAVPSYIMKCRNCGHGTDLRGCPQWPFRIEGNSKRKEINVP